MSVPANSEFEIIEIPPPEYSSVQVMQQVSCAPPPYDICVRTSCSRSAKPCWSTGVKDSCVVVFLVAVLVFGCVLLISGLILLALKQLLRDDPSVLAWCLFGSGCVVLLVSATFYRLVVVRKPLNCADGNESESASGCVSSTVSSTSLDTHNRDYAQPPEDLAGPPPYHVNSVFVRSSLSRNVAPTPIRLHRIPIATLSDRVQPLPVHFSNMLRNPPSGVTSSIAQLDNACESSRRVALSTPLTVLTETRACVPAASRSFFAVNRAFATEENQLARTSNVEVSRQEFIV